MAHLLPDGLYDQLLTDDLVLELGQNVHKDHHTLEALDSDSATRRLADALADQLASVLQEIAPLQLDDATENDAKVNRLQFQLAFVNAMLLDLRERLADKYPDQDYGANIRLLATPAQNLRAVHRKRTAPTPVGHFKLPLGRVKFPQAGQADCRFNRLRLGRYLRRFALPIR
jgi:hypothetical protein